MSNDTRRVKHAVKPGWWDTQVPPEATAPEVLEIVEREMPDHPALPKLRKYAALFWMEQDQKRYDEDFRTYRCPRCLDTGLQMLTGGEYDVSCDLRGAAYGGARKRGQIEATTRRPVYRQCSCVKTAKTVDTQPEESYE